MKGKLMMIALIAALVFGMALVSCDDGTFKDDPYKSDANKDALDWGLIMAGKDALDIPSLQDTLDALSAP